MLELTKDRLNEAHFFLAKLQAEKARQVQQARPAVYPEFLYYLSAFLNAARSVRWVLHSEEKEKYEAWSSPWENQISEAEKELFNLTTKMRNSAVKKGYAGTVSRTEKVPIPENPDPVSGSQYFGLPEWGRPVTVSEVHYVEDTNREVTKVCEQYIELLRKMVDDFEKKHPPT